LVCWRIFYYDGSEYGCEDGPPTEAPGWGVVAISNGPAALSGGDGYYCWDNDRWFGMDRMGFFQYLAEPGYKVVKFGRWTETPLFRDIYEKALKWSNHLSDGSLPHHQDPGQHGSLNG
jgi:hypothetical protein